MKSYYELLDVPRTATFDEIKRAFRQQIARYHPDKVQHLGREFQEMAADRAAALTEAYRVLSNDQLRAEHDAGLEGVGAPDAKRGSAPVQPPPDRSTVEPGPAPSAPPAPDTEAASAARAAFTPFGSERASRDQFVRQAIVGRFRDAIAKMAAAGYDERPVSGFDLALVPKPKLFAWSKGPRILARFVARVDGQEVTRAWSQAVRTPGTGSEQICVLLMGITVAPPGELAKAIAAERRRTRNGKVTLIPVNASVWEAHMPVDAPAFAKDLLARLRASE